MLAMAAKARDESHRTYKVNLRILVLNALLMIIRGIDANGKIIDIKLRRGESPSAANTSDVLQSAFRYISNGYAGIKFDDITGVWLPMTSIEFASETLPTDHYAKTMVRTVYREQPSFLRLDLPVNMNIGAELEFKIFGMLRFSIDLYAPEYGLVLHLSSRTYGVILNSNSGGEWGSEETIHENLTDGRIVVIHLLVTSIGLEISFDGIYKHTFNHRPSLQGINHIQFGGFEHSTMMEHVWRQPS